MQYRSLLFAVAASTLPLVPFARAAVFYSGYQNLSVPFDATGRFLNVATGSTSDPGVAAFDTAPWINPFFGGVQIGTSPLLRPVVSSLSGINADPVRSLSVGALVNNAATFTPGINGSSTHVGGGAGQFALNTPGNIGFQFESAPAGLTKYGWLNITINNADPGGIITDWAYDDAGGAIVVGRINQTAPSGSAQTFTLSPGTGESFTLGSAVTDTGGNINTLVKNGAGTVTLAANNTYTGNTIINGGTLALGSSNILPSTTVDLAGGTLAAGGQTDTVGTLLLSASSTIDMAGAGSNLSFADSSGLTWNGVLSIWNWTPGNSVMRFGNSAGGLNGTQLGQINLYSGAGNGTYWTASLNGNGFLVAVPEPGAVMAGLLLLTGIGWRERRHFMRIRS